MPDPISKFADYFNVARLNADHPLAQTQQTPSLPSSAIAPSLPPLGDRRSGGVSLPPRADIGIDRLLAERASATAGAPDAAGTPPAADTVGALCAPGAQRADTVPPLMLRAMTRARLRLSDVVREVFPARMQSTDRLTETLAGLDLSHAALVPGLPSAPIVLLTLALARGSQGHAADALRGLRVLRRLDVVPDIGDAWRRRAARLDPAAPGPSRPPAIETIPDRGVTTAWQTLAALATTPDGLALSQALLKRPVDDSQRIDVSLLLKAATVAAREAGIELDPEALLQRPSTGQTLAGAALLCAAARLAGDLDSAAPHTWALAAVRNDLMSDGPGSDFARINQRLMKTGLWVERATSENEALVRHPLREKSPFRALRHGVQRVDRGPAIGRHKVERDKAVNEAAIALRDHLVSAAAMPVAPATRAPGATGATTEIARPMDPANVRQMDIPTTLLRAAVLDHCLVLGGPQELERTGFDGAALTDIAARLDGLLPHTHQPDEDRDPRVAALLTRPDIQALAQLRLDADTLSKWIDDAERAQAAPAQARDPGAAPLAVARTALQHARDEALGRDTRVPDINRETVREALKDIIRNIEGSSRLRLSAGGISGVGLRQVTATISALASALFLRGRVDARLQQGRQAIFEIAMPPYDMEIVLGSQRQSARNLGLGAFIGPDLGAGKIGLNVDATLWASERNQLSGISLRLPRVGRPVPELREEFARLVDHLLDGSTGGLEAGRPAVQPLLRQLLQAFPDLTVNQIADGGDGRRRHGLGIDLAGSIGAGWFKATGSLGAYAEGQRDVSRHYTDATGRMRVSRTIDGQTNRAGAALRGALGVSQTVASSTGDAGKTDLTLGALPGALGAERILNGAFDRREEVYEDGRLHPLSFVEREFQDVDEFLAHLQRELPDWMAAGAPPERLQLLLDQIKTHVQPTHTFAARWIVTPEMKARDDAYRSAITLLEPLPNSTEAVAALRAAVESQWQDRQSLQPYSIRAYDRHSRQQTRGVDLVAQLAAVDSAEASHIDNRLDVKPRSDFTAPATASGDAPEDTNPAFLRSPESPFQSMWSPPSRATLPLLP
ncbi:hypothetical protein OU995_18540 [Roseateles sp. SL47]|uniref:hypothetical protein n=1 Tax=Roseateles sp. SL47 TaxID=2995138 RepID=UPI00226F37AE|nr:hypothetical protein [Roseateles sp. SL47]WAC71570.1 hypothetical protein OU995_18540 [Roseateles sp. SL47]